VGWRNRIIGSGEEPPDQLLANPRNWRIHPAAQQKALAGALDQVGWVQQVIVNRRSGFVVDGHLRVSLAISRGELAIPVVYVDLDENEEALVLASIDPLAGMAVTDSEQLAALLAEVRVDDADLLAMLNGVSGVSTKLGLTDPDAVPPEPETPYVQRGEVYALGAHRLMCGDSTSAYDVALLLGGEKPALMVTDPPYGVEYDPEWRDGIVGEFGQGAREKAAVSNDHVVNWGAAWALVPSDVAYCWHAGRFAGEVQASLVAAGFETRSQIVWAKQHFAISRGHYHWMHEPCWYSVRKGATAHWVGDRKQSTLWEINSLNPAGREEERFAHGTQKPVECMERPLRNHAGDVYDPFVGSGTTLIAAERQARRCFAMEIEPKYVQVAIERWEAYTGEKAERVDG
jgi:DNA modification methylase